MTVVALVPALGTRPRAGRADRSRSRSPTDRVTAATDCTRTSRRGADPMARHTDEVVITPDGPCPVVVATPGPRSQARGRPSSCTWTPAAVRLGTHGHGRATQPDLGYVVALPESLLPPRLCLRAVRHAATVFGDPEERTRLFGLMSGLTAEMVAERHRRPCSTSWAGAPRSPVNGSGPPVTASAGDSRWPPRPATRRASPPRRRSMAATLPPSAPDSPHRPPRLGHRPGVRGGGDGGRLRSHPNRRPCSRGH